MSFCGQKLRDSRQVLSGVGSSQGYAGEHITRLRGFEEPNKLTVNAAEVNRV